MNYEKTHLRQLDVLPEEVLNQSVAVIGLGGIGSPTAYMLSKMGIKKLLLFDFDVVSEHNLATQFYDLNDIGHSKALALSSRIKKELGVTTNNYSDIKADVVPQADISILAVDSMDERIRLWKNTKEKPQWVIDARMGLEFCRIYAFNTYDDDAIKAYEKSLYPSSEAVDLPCSARAVVYNTFFIGSIITSIVKKILVGEDVPFETMADIGKFAIKTFPAKRR